MQATNGALLSGVPAFVEVWKMLPQWHWVARLAQLPSIMGLLALAYHGFLPLRTLLSRLFGQVQRLRQFSRPN